MKSARKSDKHSRSVSLTIGLASVSDPISPRVHGTLLLPSLKGLSSVPGIAVKKGSASADEMDSETMVIQVLTSSPALLLRMARSHAKVLSGVVDLCRDVTILEAVVTANASQAAAILQKGFSLAVSEVSPSPDSTSSQAAEISRLQRAVKAKAAEAEKNLVAAKTFSSESQKLRKNERRLTEEIDSLKRSLEECSKAAEVRRSASDKAVSSSSTSAADATELLEETRIKLSESQHAYAALQETLAVFKVERDGLAASIEASNASYESRIYTLSCQLERLSSEHAESEGRLASVICSLESNQREVFKLQAMLLEAPKSCVCRESKPKSEVSKLSPRDSTYMEREGVTSNNIAELFKEDLEMVKRDLQHARGETVALINRLTEETAMREREAAHAARRLTEERRRRQVLEEVKASAELQLVIAQRDVKALSTQLIAAREALTRKLRIPDDEAFGDTFEEVMQEEFDNMKRAFLEQIAGLNEEMKRMSRDCYREKREVEQTHAEEMRVMESRMGS